MPPLPHCEHGSGCCRDSPWGFDMVWIRARRLPPISSSARMSKPLSDKELRRSLAVARFPGVSRTGRPTSKNFLNCRGAASWTNAGDYAEYEGATHSEQAWSERVGPMLNGYFRPLISKHPIVFERQLQQRRGRRQLRGLALQIRSRDAARVARHSREIEAASAFREDGGELVVTGVERPVVDDPVPLLG